MERIDRDTGEVQSISEAAYQASHEREVAERADALGFGKAKLYAALMAAVANMPVWITTDKDNPAFKRDGKVLKYASLKQILETVRPHLHKEGIRIRQGSDRSWPNDEGGGVKGRLIPVYTDLIHAESGEVDRTLIEIPLSRMDPQGMGIAIAYGRRYSLLAALGLATDEADDDGAGAVVKSIADGHAESQDLADLKAEMAAFRTVNYLLDWGRGPDVTRRIQKLSDAEAAIARAAFAERRDALRDGGQAPEDEKPAKKGAKP